MDEISICLKQGDSYVFLAKAWCDSIKHAGEPHPAVLFDWFSSRLFGASVVSVHLTYPDTGHFHQTYSLESGVTARLSAERINLTWSRDLEPPDLPDKGFLGFINHQLQRRNPPRFDEFTSETVMVLANSAMPIPHPHLELLRPQATPRAHWKVINTDGLEGTLNLHPLVAGRPDPKFDTAGLKTSFNQPFIVGTAALYFGFLVRVIPAQTPP